MISGIGPHGEPDASPGELEERKDRFEQAEPCDHQRDDPRPRLERPEAEGDEEPGDPGGDRQPTPQTDRIEHRKVAKNPEPVEAEDSQAP